MFSLKVELFASTESTCFLLIQSSSASIYRNILYTPSSLCKSCKFFECWYLCSAGNICYCRKAFLAIEALKNIKIVFTPSVFADTTRTFAIKKQKICFWSREAREQKRYGNFISCKEQTYNPPSLSIIIPAKERQDLLATSRMRCKAELEPDTFENW